MLVKLSRREDFLEFCSPITTSWRKICSKLERNNMVMKAYLWEVEHVGQRSFHAVSLLFAVDLSSPDGLRRS